MKTGERALQRRMYLSVARAEYVGPERSRLMKRKKAEECLKAHKAGCGCWRTAVGPLSGGRP